MTITEDWQFRAKYLRDLADKRYADARRADTEVKELNNLADRCEDEANRLHRATNP